METGEECGWGGRVKYSGRGFKILAGFITVWCKKNIVTHKSAEDITSFISSAFSAWTATFISFVNEGKRYSKVVPCMHSLSIAYVAEIADILNPYSTVKYRNYVSHMLDNIPVWCKKNDDVTVQFQIHLKLATHGRSRFNCDSVPCVWSWTYIGRFFNTEHSLESTIFSA